MQIEKIEDNNKKQTYYGSHSVMKHNYRKIKWFNPNWFNDVIAIK